MRRERAASAQENAPAPPSAAAAAQIGPVAVSPNDNSKQKERQERIADRRAARQRRRAEAKTQAEDATSASDASLLVREVAEEEESGEGTSEVDRIESVSPSRARPGLSSPVKCRVVGEEKAIAQFSDALKQAFAAAGLSLNMVAEAADLLVLLPGAELRNGERGLKATCLVGDATRPLADSLPAIRSMRGNGAAFVDIHQIVSRYRLEGVIEADGSWNELGNSLVAAAVRDVAFAQANVVLPLAPEVSPKDLLEILGYSRDAKLLTALDWPGKLPPASLDVSVTAAVLEPFLEGKIYQPGGAGGAENIPCEIPFDWRATSNPRAASALYGLDVVSNVLTYWYQRANRVPVRRAPHIEALLKQRAITASGLLAGAGAIILDFLRANVTLPQTAWQLPVVRRRATTLELFLLCCKLAVQRRMKFDESVCAPVFHELVHLLECLRRLGGLEPGSAAGFEGSTHLVGLALPLRKTKYGASLLQYALQSLQICQLEAGMSGDGVWEEGFVQHTAVLNGLRVLSADLGVAKIPDNVIAEPMLKLAHFIDVLVTPEGQYPSIGSTAPGDARRTATLAQAVWRKAGTKAKRPSDTYFPDGGYFISRSPKVDRKLSSHLVVMARGIATGGMSLSFSVGGRSVLIGGGAAGKPAPREVRRAALEDPASHNAVRIDELLHRRATDKESSAIRFTGNWQERSWAAARLVNTAFVPAVVARTVVHLKTANAILVVDELHNPEKDSTFEQFWHLAPGLQPHGPPLFFSARKGGLLSVSFDDGVSPDVLSGGDGVIGWTMTSEREVVPNPYLVRTKSTDQGVMSAFFRWGTDHINPVLAVEPLQDGWRAVLSGEGPSMSFLFESGNLTAIT